MFETVAPEAFEPRTRRVFYETLPISIAVHVVAAGAVLASMIWNVVLPTQSPKMIVAYSLTQVPDPPPPPPPPKAEPPKPIVTSPKLAPPPPALPLVVSPFPPPVLVSAIFVSIPVVPLPQLVSIVAVPYIR